MGTLLTILWILRGVSELAEFILAFARNYREAKQRGDIPPDFMDVVRDTVREVDGEYDTSATATKQKAARTRVQSRVKAKGGNGKLRDSLANVAVEMAVQEKKRLQQSRQDRVVVA